MSTVALNLDHFHARFANITEYRDDYRDCLAMTGVGYSNKNVHQLHTNFALYYLIFYHDIPTPTTLITFIVLILFLHHVYDTHMSIEITFCSIYL